MESSMWRLEKGTNRVNCNACGLYFNTKGKHRDPNGKAMRSGVNKAPGDKVSVPVSKWQSSTTSMSSSFY